MTIGFILINTAPGWEYQAYAKLKLIPGIVEIYPLFGEYDFIAKIETRDFSKLNSLVLERVRTIEGIVNTCTLCIVKSEAQGKKWKGLGFRKRK